MSHSSAFLIAEGPPADPLFLDRLGGSFVLVVVALRLMERLWDDPRLRRHFGECKHQDQLPDLLNFLRRACGSPETTAKESGRGPFGNCPISEPELEILLAHLRDTLHDRGVKVETIQEALHRVEVCARLTGLRGAGDKEPHRPEAPRPVNSAAGLTP